MTTLPPEGYAAEAVAKDEVELCIHQISEILAVKGVTLAGPLPGELEKVSVYCLGPTCGGVRVATILVRTSLAWLSRASHRMLWRYPLSSAARP
jgi:hypothetical protein